MRLGLVFSQYSLMRQRVAHSKDDCPDLALKTITVEEGRAGRGCRVAPEIAWHEAQQETSPEEAGPAEMADRKEEAALEYEHTPEEGSAPEEKTADGEDIYPEEEANLEN